MLNPLALPHQPPIHLLMLLWLSLTSLVSFGAVVAYDQGLIQGMIASDRSQICLVVIAMYLVGLGHTFVRTHYLSTQLLRAEQFLASLKAQAAHSVGITPEGVQFAAGSAVTRSFLVDYLIERTASRQRPDREEESKTDLLEAYAAGVRSANEFGWFYIDLMLKVGFLGTLVGFILMLSSVSDSGSLDASSMQKVLAHMSLGMSTALYTTMISLVAGILLSVPYYLLDRGLERLLQMTVHVTEVLLPVRLAPSAT